MLMVASTVMYSGPAQCAMGFDKKISRNLKNVLIKTGILGPQNSLIGIQSQTYPFFGRFLDIRWILDLGVGKILGP